MAIFKIKNQKLIPLKEIRFDLEKHIQKITEENLETIFGLEFVASEFNLENFWIDTLAFDPENKAFVVIEYKKRKDISIMDQGQTYLNLILDHKAEVLLEYNERKNKNLQRKDISWEHTKVIFIAPNFTPYQKRALHPKLPFELWEVKRYEDNLIIYNQIQPLILERTGKPAPSLIGRAGKEIKVNTVEDIINKCSPFQKEAIRAIEEVVFELGDDIKEVAGKKSITFRTRKPFMQILFYGKTQQNFITIYFNEGYKIKDYKKLLKSKGKIGKSMKIYSLGQIQEIRDYIKQAYENSLK
jgi:predicted transport protein